MPRLLRSRADRIAWGLLAAAVLAGLLLLGQRIVLSPAGRVIVQSERAPWIQHDVPFSAFVRQWGRRDVAAVRFSRLFSLPPRAPGTPVWLELRAFGAFEATLDGGVLPLDGAAGRSWKRAQRIDVASWLGAGPHRLVVKVANRQGPALLSLRLESGDAVLVSDPSWTATVGRRTPRPARLADDRLRHPEAGELPSPGEALADHAPTLAALVLAWSALWLGARRLLARREAAAAWLERHALLVATALAGLAWLAFFLRKLLRLPLTHGFDVSGHLRYVTWIGRGQGLPVATDGWSMYHPPLYHAIVAGLGVLGDLASEAVAMVSMRLPAFGAGLAIVWLSGRLAARLHPARPLVQVSALAFAAVLPMNLYVAGYLTNEGLLAALSAAALVDAVDWLQAEPAARTPARIARLSLWLGLALLTKYTAIVLVAVVLVFVGGSLLVDARREARPRWREWVALVLPMLLVAGWFYARNVWLFGRPLVPNWDLPGPTRTWWSPPGFHTPGYWLRFGAVLLEPWYAALGSFWDALYSTAWGDGMLGGVARVAGRTPVWRYDWMAVGYWAALPVTALVVAGLGPAVRDVLREQPARRRAALALPLVQLAALGYTMLLVTVELPYFGQAKAIYALSLTPVLALAFGRALDACDAALRARGLEALRAALFGLLATAGSAFYLGLAG